MRVRSTRPGWATCSTTRPLRSAQGPNLGNVGREILFRGEQRGAEEADIAFDLVEGSHGAAVPTIRRASVACRTCTPTAVNISSASCCPAAQLLDGSIGGCAIVSGP